MRKRTRRVASVIRKRKSQHKDQISHLQKGLVGGIHSNLLASIFKSFPTPRMRVSKTERKKFPSRKRGGRSMVLKKMNKKEKKKPTPKE